MTQTVPLSTVLAFLDEHEYLLARRRKYPDTERCWFVVFVCRGRPTIAFPVRTGQVLRKHFDKIKEIIANFEGD